LETHGLTINPEILGTPVTEVMNFARTATLTLKDTGTFRKKTST